MSVLSRNEKKWSAIKAFCAGCGGLIEEGEPRLVMEDQGTLTMRHEPCERKGALPIFRSADSLLGRLSR